MLELSPNGFKRSLWSVLREGVAHELGKSSNIGIGSGQATQPGHGWPIAG